VGPGEWRADDRKAARSEWGSWEHTAAIRIGVAGCDTNLQRAWVVHERTRYIEMNLLCLTGRCLFNAINVHCKSCDLVMVIALWLVIVKASSEKVQLRS